MLRTLYMNIHPAILGSMWDTGGEVTRNYIWIGFTDSNLNLYIYIYENLYRFFFFPHCNHWSSCIGVVGVGYVCSLVQWQSLCIYLNCWDFFFLSHSHSSVLYYCKYKTNIHQLTTGLLAINIFAPFLGVCFVLFCFFNW